MPCCTVISKTGCAGELCMLRKKPIHLIINILENNIHFKVSFLLWRMWFRRIPIWEGLIRRGITDSMECFCSNDDIQESFMHFLVLSCDLYQLLRLIFFIKTIGFHFSIVNLRKVLEVSWNVECSKKVKLVFKILKVDKT